MKQFLKTTDGKETDPLTAAQDSFDRESYAEALEQTEKVLQYEAGNARAWSLKGDVLLKLGKPEEALACFEKASSLDSELFDADVWNNKGNALFDVQKYELAGECYEHALLLVPDYKWAWRNKGLAHYNLRDFEEALVCYDKTLELDPEYAVVWVDKGNLNFEREMYEEALDCYDKAISLDPENLWVWGNKGWTLFKLEKFDQALECYDRSTALDPNRVETWNEKGLVLQNLHRSEEALQCFDKANELDPEFPYAWRNKASALENLHRVEEAKKCYQKALEVSEKTIAENPKDTNIWILRSVCFLNLDDLPNTEKALNDALERDPKNLDAMMNLVGLYGDNMFEFEKAADYMRRILAIDPTDSTYRMNYVEILLKNHCPKEARDLALKLLPEITQNYHVCLLHLLILISHAFEGSQEETEKEFDGFLDSFLNLPEPKVIPEDQWTFKGMVRVISKSSLPAFRKVYALALIDLVTGKIKWQDLTFSSMDLAREPNTK